MSPEEIAKTVAGFQADEKEIISTIVQRIDRGRSIYGPWEIGGEQPRNYVQEALEEALDGMNYIAAELVRLKTERYDRSLRIYVCHPWSDNPEANAKDIEFICKAIVAKRSLPVAPQIYLSRFMDEATEREQAMNFCLQLLADCDLVLAFGTPSEGMRRELTFARSRGIPVRHLDGQEGLS
jgi:hypothetical protein